MRSGLLRSQVQYQEQTGFTRNADNQRIPTWTTLGTFRAFIRSANGREVIQAQQLQAQLGLVVNHRYQGTLPKPSGRYVFGSRTLNVTWVDNVDSRNREVKAFVVEQVAT